MSKFNPETSIPPVGFVRFIASIAMLIGVVLTVFPIVYYQNIGWFAILFVASGLTSVYCSYKSLRTGDPSWILLDLLLK